MPKSSVFPTGKLPLEYLEQLLGSIACSDPRLAAGPCVGEDVAVIDMGDRYLVVKTDPITFATDQIGWYAVHVNANDIATSGARPLWMLATLLLPEKSTTPELVQGIFDQLRTACQESGILLVGGHTEVTYGLERPIVVGVMLGEVAKENLITTSGAQEGDAVLLVKGIPIEATAIIAHEKAEELCARGYEEAFIEEARAFLHSPGISVLDVAQVAARHAGVHAMHDPTEGGLATGLHELAVAAQVGLCVDLDAVPIIPQAARLCAEYGLDPMGALASGALIVAVDAEHADALLQAYHAQGVPCARIGKLLQQDKGVYALREGQHVTLPRFDTDEITKLF